MLKRTVLLFFFGTIMSCVSQKDLMPDKTQPKKIEGYDLVWNDEFYYKGKPDPDKWSFEKGFIRNKEPQWYQSNNANCKDGVLLIQGKKEVVNNPNYTKNSKNWKLNRKQANYTSASVNTKNKASWKFGIFEVRARIDSTRGSWPAIWTLGNEKRWPANGEIDLLEFYIINKKQSVFANTAWKDEGDIWDAKWNTKIKPLTYFLKKDKNWLDKFHVWKMAWDENAIRLFLDDELQNEFLLKDVSNPDGFNPFLQEHYLLLNLALDSNGGNPSEFKFPIKYEVDYVRVYQKKRKNKQTL